MRNIIWLVALLVGFAFAGTALAGAGNIYSVRCALCHGQKGEGTDRGPALKDNEFITKGKAEDIKKVIIDGRDGAAKKYKQFSVGMHSYPEFDRQNAVAELIRFLQCGLQTDTELLSICASKDIIRIEAESVAKKRAELVAQKRAEEDIKKLTLFIFVRVNNLDSIYKNRPRYISGVKEMKDLAKKISKDSQLLKNEILEEVKLYLESWNNHITEEHTAFVNIAIEPYVGILTRGAIFFKVSPYVSVSIAKGRHEMKSFKSLLINGKLKKVGGKGGVVYDTNINDDRYDKMVSEWARDAGGDLASYFPKAKEEETK